VRFHGSLFFYRGLANRLAVRRHLFLSHQRRIAIEIRISKEARGASSVVENIEEELAIIVSHARAAADDLLELRHGIDGAHDDDVLASRYVNTCREHLRRREDYWRRCLELHEASEVRPPNMPLVRDYTRYVVGVLSNEVGIAIVQS